MPELPEVETVRRGLQALIVKGTQVAEVKVYSPKLRFPMPKDLQSILNGQTLQSFERRAKYLLWMFDKRVLISHLGMTGSWREYQTKDALRKHDHLSVIFKSGQHLLYNDPRRFGYMDVCDKTELSKHPYLKKLGPEPLSIEFNADYLYQYTRKRNAALKTAIMDQRCVVGVGNIYACEALFLSGLKPQKIARQLSLKKAELLCQTIKTVLMQAIDAGGSTIKDFKQAGGESGYFQHQFQVYGKAGQPCPKCHEKTIKNIVIAGRSSFFCSQCQK